MPDQHDYFEFLRGKRVALVGAAGHLATQYNGDTIDSYDVVVRVNQGWRFPETLVPHLGSRSDVVYHTLVTHREDGEAPGGFNGFDDISRVHLQQMNQSGVRYLVPVVEPNNQRIIRVRRLGVSGLHVITFKRNLRHQLIPKMQTFPNSGVVAAYHLLQSNLNLLDLYGFDFFTTQHHPGYNHETPEFAASAGTRTNDETHDQFKNARFLRRLCTGDSRMNLSETTLEKMKEWNL